MNKKITILVAIVSSLLITSVLGFRWGDKTTVVAEYQSVAQKVADSENLEYKEIVNRQNDVYGENYSGDYIYANSNYEFLVDPTGRYVEAIFPNTTKMPVKTSEDKIVLDSGMVALDYFKQNWKDLIKGELDVETYSRYDNTKTYEIVEKKGILETGTKASISVDENGMLLAAVFVEGSYDSVSKIKENDLITSDIAYEKALGELKNYYDIIELKQYENNLKTFKGTIYWQLCFGALVNDNSGAETYFEIKVNAQSGEILEIVKAI